MQEYYVQPLPGPSRWEVSGLRRRAAWGGWD